MVSEAQLFQPDQHVVGAVGTVVGVDEDVGETHGEVVGKTIPAGMAPRPSSFDTAMTVPCFERGFKSWNWDTLLGNGSSNLLRRRVSTNRGARAPNEKTRRGGAPRRSVSDQRGLRPLARSPRGGPHEVAGGARKTEERVWRRVTAKNAMATAVRAQ